MVGEYGRYHTLQNLDGGFIAPGQLRGCTFNAASQHLWVHQLGIWCGPDSDQGSSSVTGRVAIYAVDGSLNPTSRLGYSASFTASTAMDENGNGGAAMTAAVAASTGPSTASIPLRSGTRYHLAVLGTGGYLAHKMQAASRITADNEKFYNRSGLSQPPPDPFGAYSSSTQGHLTIWANAEVNVAPNTPANLAPAGSINQTAPTFEADFTDGNTDHGDEINQFRIQVRRVSDGTSFWDATLTATSAEKAADAFSRAYAGTTLVRGTAYEWRTQMSDWFGAWSAWTAWTAFTPVSLGFVTLDQDPTGKIEDNTPDFEGRWTHQDAKDMTHVQVGLLNGDGSVALQTGAEFNIADVASSASPGTSFTVPWADTGFTTLAWGTSYMYKIRGKDSDGLWSDWSAGRTFSTNAAPSIPANLSPNNPVFNVTDYPLLSCTASDADDTTGTGLTVFARIKDDTGSVLSTETMTYNGTTGRWEFQTTSSELATYDTYRWDAYSYDGTLYSGEAGSSGAAAKSAEATFTFAEGVGVSVSSPTVDQVLTSSSLTVTWSVTGGGQVAWGIQIYDADGAEVYAESNVTLGLSGALTTYTITDSPAIRNGLAYSVVVSVLTSTLDAGNSTPVPFTVAYTPPDQVANVVADTIRVTTDIWASAVRLTWDQTSYGTDVWQRYIITRTALTGPDAGTVTLIRLTSPSDQVFIDYLPASGHEYTYGITQTVLEGVDPITSDPVEVTATVTLGGVVLVGVASPEGHRTSLRYTNERDFGRRLDAAIYTPLDGSDPTTVRSRTRIREPQFDAQLFDDDAATAAVRRDELDELDESAGTICYRDNHGRKLFLVLDDLTITDQVPDWYVASLSFRSQKFVEGV